MIPSDPSPARPTASQEELARMSLMEHLEELRKRILWSVLAVTVAFFPCWAYYHEIYRFLVAPLKRPIIAENLPMDFDLASLSMAEPLILYVKMAALVAVFIASPFILCHLSAFISPWLYNREKKLAGPFLFFSSLFFLCGGAFGYYIA